MSEKKLSRRDFLKGALAGSAAVALGSVSGVAAFAEEKGIYTPGTYSATADGMGKVIVKATFDANSILSVDLDVSGETPTIGQAAKDALVEQIMAAQGAEIDGVSSATITSTAVKTALKNCIAQAKGEAVNSGSVKPQVESDGAFILKDITADDVNASVVELEPITDFAKEITVDVVVCGAGAAGVPAAVRALDLGATVAVLQKEAVPVSQGNCSSCIVKGESTEAGLKKWLTFATAVNCWRNNRKLLEAYVDRSEEAIRFLVAKGGLNEENEFKNEKYGFSIYQYSNDPFTGLKHDGTQTYDFGDDVVSIYGPWFGPKPSNYGTLVSAILKEAQEEYGDKLQVFFSTPVVQLLKDADGAIVGCVGKDLDGNYIKVNAKSVILATGAYENNATMVRRFCPDIEKFDKKVVHRTGDGNILAIEAGGCMEPVAHSRVMHDFDAGLMWDEPPYLIVNMNGERFIDEEVDMAYISNALRWQPSYKGENMDPEHQESGSIGWYCQIYDNDYMQYATGPVPDFVMARYLKEEDPSLHVSVFPELIDTFRADTIEELAEKLGLPVEKTVETFNRYNELCEKGEDVDFGKPSKYLHAFKTAPFWGTRRHIRCSSITAGVLTDEYGRVTTEEGEVIKGLYAVGNLGGQFFGAPDYPFFHPGLSLGHAVTFGYIAGEHAAQNK
ncbi:MAG: FAD-binding protein [Oscillospiraceae bacterium]|nr:FAD-binding protein [Oscillospiraceae bacterium]